MADAAAGDIRSEILAELATGSAGDAPAPVEKAEAAPVEDAPAEEVEVAADDAGPDEGAPEEESPLDEDEPADDDEPELKSDDPKEQKLLDNVRRAEKRMREAASRRDADFQAERAKWQTQVDRVAELDRLAARIKYDPIPALRALGVTDEDLESIAQAAFAESPEGQKNPARKAHAQQMLREREKQEKLTANEKRIADLEAKLERQSEQSRVQAEAAAYIQQINTAAATKFPLVQHMLKSDVEDTQDALVRTYDRLLKTSGRAPKPAEVVAAYDKAERARLQRIGIDPTTIIKGKAAPVAAKPVEKKPANGNAPTPAVATNGAKKLTPEEERAAILAELAAAQ